MATKIKVLDGGKGQVPNPYYCKDLSIKTCWDMPDSSICDGCRKHAEFEEANPAYDIVSPLSVKVGDEISATLVWQLQQVNEEWQTVDWDCSDQSVWLHSRQAWQLTPEKEGEEKPVSAKNAHTETVVASPDVDEDISLADEYVLICNFMEYKILVHSIAWITTNCKFKSSWDWLMPVVEKIESFGYIFSIYKNQASTCHEKNDTDGDFEVTGVSKVDAAYKLCISFIQWYNLNNSN